MCPSQRTLPEVDIRGDGADQHTVLWSRRVGYFLVTPVYPATYTILAGKKPNVRLTYLVVSSPLILL